MSPRSTAGTVALGFVAVVGCSGSTSPGSGSALVTESDFASAYGQAVCANVGSCCANAGLPFDTSVCEQRIAASYQDDAPQGGVAANEKDLAGCTSALVTAARQCDLDPVVGPVGPCAPFFSAEVQGRAGDPCGMSCSVEGFGVSCSGLSGGASSPNGQAAAASCFDSDGLFCNDHAVCQELPDVGRPCVNSYCSRAGWCDANNVCQARGVAGATCQDDRQCADGFYCPAANGISDCPLTGGQCTTTFGPPNCAKTKPNGAACNIGAECEVGSCTNGACGDSSAKLLNFICVK